MPDDKEETRYTATITAIAPLRADFRILVRFIIVLVLGAWWLLNEIKSGKAFHL